MNKQAKTQTKKTPASLALLPKISTEKISPAGRLKISLLVKSTAYALP